MADKDWKTNLKIQKAAEISKQFDFAGTIVIGFTKDGHFDISSYGIDRTICRELGKLCDRFGSELETGELPTNEIVDAITNNLVKLKKPAESV